MNTNQQLIELGISLANAISKSTVTYFSDRIKKAKTAKDRDETIAQLEDIIDELINDKRELIEIGRKYEEITSFQKITDHDLKYITEKLFPVLNEVLTQAAQLSSDPNALDELKTVMSTIEPIISIETFNILQMLGFNFKDAIGEPLTKFIRSLILANSKSNLKTELEISINRQGEQFYKVLQNPEAVEAYNKISNSNK